MHEIAEDMLDGMEEFMRRDPRWGKKSQQPNLMFELKVVLAIFLTPLVRKKEPRLRRRIPHRAARGLDAPLAEGALDTRRL